MGKSDVKFKKNALFISFEGGEGAGKTTVIREVEVFLRNNNINFMTTREPGGVRIAEKIREVILDNSHTEMDGVTEALLYASARRQHLVERIIPALQEGKLVICDRFVDSSVVYQGYARGLGMDEVFTINKMAIGDIMPDYTFWLDVDSKSGVERVYKTRSNEVNRLDLEGLAFHNKVHEGYSILHKKDMDRIIRIDANGTAQQTVSHVLGYLSRILEVG